MRYTKAVQRFIAERKREGVSNRAIARALGCSHTFVNSILKRRPTPTTEREVLDANFLDIIGAERRVGTCPDCRRRVRLPCLACALRRRGLVAPVDAKEDDAATAPPLFPLGVDLRDEEKKRYLEIKKRKDKEAGLYGNDELDEY